MKRKNTTKLPRQRAGEGANEQDLKQSPQSFWQAKNTLQLLEKTFASLRDAVFIIDAKTTQILDCNPAASQIFGYGKEEMLGQTTNFLHVDKEMLEEFRKSLFLAAGERGSLDLPEFQMRRRNGEVFFTNHTVMPLEDDQGKRIGWVTVVRDITERKRMEEAFRESEALYRSLFENMLDGFAYCEMIFDDQSHPTDFVYLGVNNAFESLTGLKNVVGKRFTEVIPGVKESHPEVFETYGRVALTGQPERFEIDFTPLGRWFWISVYSPRKNHFVAVFENITDRKRSEEALLYRANITEVASDALYATNADLKILVWNKSAEGLYGWNADEVLGKDPRDLFRPRFLTGQTREEVFEEIKAKGKWRDEVINMRKDGSQITIIASINAIKNVSGNVVGYAVCHTDITDRKRMETDLRRSHDELDERVRERTAQLQDSENKLRALASELINAQETERKRIAHELHDSLAAQLAAIKYRLERKISEGGSSDPIILQEIIHDVQNANVETRRIMANLRPSVLDDLGILPALSSFSRETEKAYPGTTIEYSTRIEEGEVPEELKIVLFRVVQESVTNAIRHGKASRIRIGVERTNGWLRLNVADNGRGFDAARLETKSKSHGIGLNSMEQRIDSTGGIFSISSSPGQGTTVTAEWRIG